MKHIDVKDIFSDPFYIGKTVTVCGWVRTSRDSKNISFLEEGFGFRPRHEARSVRQSERRLRREREERRRDQRDFR